MTSRWFIPLGLVCATGLLVHSQEKQVQPPDPYTLQITGVLLDKEGSPLKNNRVWLYPLDAKGEALIVRTMPPGYVYKIWNPMVQTEASGKFTLVLPLVARIDDHPITELVIGVGNPEGGLSVRSEKGIEYVDPNRQKEDCLTMTVETSKLRLLRKGPDILKVKLDQKKPTQVDLGKIVVE
jgi:hypothetical protein